MDSLQHKPSDISPILHPLRGLLIAQFFGAFNDNAWKLMVALLAIRQATAGMASGPELEAAAQTQTALTFIIFTFKFFVRHQGLFIFNFILKKKLNKISKRYHY